MSRNICLGCVILIQLCPVDSWRLIPPPSSAEFNILTCRCPPTLRSSSGGRLNLCQVYEDSHPFRTICQLLSGHQPGAGRSLTPAMPQQHCPLGPASPCQLLISALVSELAQRQKMLFVGLQRWMQDILYFHLAEMRCCVCVCVFVYMRS